MSKQICFLEQLPDDFGTKGKTFTPYHERATHAKEFVHRHASEAGLVLGLVSFAMVVL